MWLYSKFVCFTDWKNLYRGHLKIGLFYILYTYTRTMVACSNATYTDAHEYDPDFSLFLRKFKQGWK